MKMSDFMIARTWVPHLVCPRCRSHRVKTTRTMPICPGNTARVRYHRCQAEGCGIPFKSVEVLTASNISPPDDPTGANAGQSGRKDK